jgi:hypothetical protein
MSILMRLAGMTLRQQHLEGHLRAWDVVRVRELGSANEQGCVGLEVC